MNNPPTTDVATSEDTPFNLSNPLTQDVVAFGERNPPMEDLVCQASIKFEWAKELTALRMSLAVNKGLLSTRAFIMDQSTRNNRLLTMN